MTALIASPIRISPPEISRTRDGKFLKQLPNQNPLTDIKKEAAPITKAGKSNAVSDNFRLTPAAKASILVAIPIEIRHFSPMQQIVSSFCSKASFINFTPRIKNIINTKKLEKFST